MNKELLPIKIIVMGDGRKKINPNTLHALAFMEQLPSNEVTSFSSHFAKSTVRECCNVWAWWLLNSTSLLIPVQLFTQLNPHCEVSTVRISCLIMAHFTTYIILQLLLKMHLSVKKYLDMQRCKEIVWFLKLGIQYIFISIIYLP